MSEAAGGIASRHRRPRLGLSVKLYAAIGGAVALTLAASVVAWISFVELGQLQRRITREHIPSITDSLRLAQQSALIAAMAPTLVTASNEAERRHMMVALRAQQDIIVGLTHDLEKDATRTTDPGIAPHLVAEIRAASSDLFGVLDRLDQSVGRQLELRAALTDRHEQAVESHRRLIEILAPLLDDATLS